MIVGHIVSTYCYSLIVVSRLLGQFIDLNIGRLVKMNNKQDSSVTCDCLFSDCYYFYLHLVMYRMGSL